MNKIYFWLSSNIEKIFSYLDSIIFSKDLIPENITEIENWWYISPEIDQQIALYSKQSFEFIAQKYHRNYYKDKNIHVFIDKTFDKDPQEYLFSEPKSIFSKMASKIFKQ